MLSSVLNSERAIEVNIAIMRAFVKIREVLATHKDLADRLSELEKRMGRKDQEAIALFEAIRKLMAPPPEKKKRPIGFIVDRVRAGHYRILYTIEHDVLVVCVVKVGHRKDVYKQR